MNHIIDSDLAKKLKNQFINNEIGQKFFQWAANRDRDRSETTIRTVMARTGMNRAEAVNLMKGLEALGCGQFLVGRRGAETRMRWDYSLQSIGAAGLGQANEVEELPDEVKLAGEIDDDFDWDSSDDDGLITHKFVIRPEVTITIQLPVDITAREAARLATFIQSIPFE